MVRQGSGSVSDISRTGTPMSVMDGVTDRVKVAVRVRPLMPHEVERSDKEAVMVAADGSFLQCVTVGAGDREMRKNYKFDLCLSPEAQQLDVFEATGVRQLVDSALAGYAATVFAYGQTGSGKTYTMAGMEERLASDEWLERERHGGESRDGIIPRAARYLFEDLLNAREADPSLRFTVRASYCEIYNEQVYDLLNLKSDTLPVRWNEKNGFFVQGLLVCTCENVDDVMAVVNEGSRNRTVGSHKLNLDSSRSHCILTLRVESTTIDPDDGHQVVKYGKIVFTDLAGSERLKESNSEGIAKKETGQINKSLFALGKVISALGDAKKKSSHVPYRDSKLTKLLMDSLGGSSLTIMIACVSPSHVYLEETLNTLNYATRANNIKNKPSVHVDPQEQLIFNQRQEIKLLRLENEWLREQLSGRGADGAAFPLPRTWGATPGPGSVGHGSVGPGSVGPGSVGAGSVASAYPAAAAAGSSASTRGPRGSRQRLAPSPLALGVGYYGGADTGEDGDRGRSQSVSLSRPHRVPPLSEPSRPSSGSPRLRPRPGTGRSDRSGTGSPRTLPHSGGSAGSNPGSPSGSPRTRRGRAGSGSSPGSSASDSKIMDSLPDKLRRRLEHYDEMESLMKGYQDELQRLRREYGRVQARATSKERDYGNVMTENEQLAARLEHLEEVFVSGGGAELSMPGVLSASGSPSDTEWGASDSRAAEVAEEEAERLRNALRKVLEDNEVLRRKLDMLDRGQPGAGSDEETYDEAPGDDEGDADGGPVRHGGSGRDGPASASPEVLVLRKSNRELSRRVSRLQQREAELLRLLSDARRGPRSPGRRNPRDASRDDMPLRSAGGAGGADAPMPSDDEDEDPRMRAPDRNGGLSLKK